jgi:hypothetical protein
LESGEQIDTSIRDATPFGDDALLAGLGPEGWRQSGKIEHYNVASLYDKIDGHFREARERRKQLAADPARVEEVLRAGAKRARDEAQKTMALVREAVGMKAQPVSAMARST